MTREEIKFGNALLLMRGLLSGAILLFAYYKAVMGNAMLLYVLGFLPCFLGFVLLCYYNNTIMMRNGLLIALGLILGIFTVLIMGGEIKACGMMFVAMIPIVQSIDDNNWYHDCKEKYETY